MSLEVFLIDGLLFLYSYLELIQEDRLSQEEIEGLKVVDYQHKEGKEADRCVVCIQDLREKDRAVALNCRHMFHEGCIKPWF